jgi:adenylate cyclase
MQKFEELFENIYDTYSKSKISSNRVAATKSLLANVDAESRPNDIATLGPQNEYLLQTQIRPLFGKHGVNESEIGTHPDFIDLEGTDTGTKNQYVCTLFVDIKGSTRLSLLYPLDTVYLFKNAVIKTCVEVIRSFDGHVHRLMGDAVMAFFGGSDTDKENAVADAINCSITLRAVLEESIKPWMIKNGIDAKDFGFRVGCDFGDDHEVLWGSFGYHNVGEVSATGLQVDMASKLQGLANKNQAMLGQGLLDFIDWPAKYSKIKVKNKNGETNSLPVVIPNLTDVNGTPIDYKMRILNYHNSINFSALPRAFRASLEGSRVIDNTEISYKCFVDESSSFIEYRSGSRYLNKQLNLKFEIKASTRGRLNFPLKVLLTKTNHGHETPDTERDIEQTAVTKQLIKQHQNSHDRSVKPFSIIVLDEYTQYRGLHTMKCEIKDNNNRTVFVDWIGVMIR